MVFKCIQMLRYGKCGMILERLENDSVAELRCPKCGSYFTENFLEDENEISVGEKV